MEKAWAICGGRFIHFWRSTRGSLRLPWPVKRSVGGEQPLCTCSRRRPVRVKEISPDSLHNWTCGPLFGTPSYVQMPLDLAVRMQLRTEVNGGNEDLAW